MYLTYTEYKDGGGTVTELAFPLLLKKAEYKLNYWTQNRLKTTGTIIDEVKDLLILMVDKLSENYLEGDIVSFGNDGVNVNYATPLNVENTLYNMAVEMLPVELINVGVI